MDLNRREFLGTAAAMGAALRSTSWSLAAAGLGEGARTDFPWATKETYLNCAAYHPIGVHSARAMREYVDFRLNGPPPEITDIGASGRGTGGEKQAAVKELYGRLINARPTEIAFVQSTSDGESVIVAGLDLVRGGGNVVIDDLHYGSAVYMYKRLEQEHGLDVRVVKHRDWTIDMRDMERAIDAKTRLVSMALVSNINGYLHDVKAISALAHAHGAYVYADVIQAAGAVPIDVKAMGLDFCACSSYKWLMGERGFGFLYVREDLQDVVKPMRYGHRQVSSFDPKTSVWKPEPGAARYETGNVSNVAVAGVYESLRYILGVGVPNIRAHVKPLTDRMLRELPGMGYPSITPPGNDTPIVVFSLKDSARVAASLKKANVAVTVGEGRIRISPSVFNTQGDVDKLLAAMKG